MSVSVEDLNIQQLAEVKRQLDEVYSLLFVVLQHHSSNQRSLIQELTHLTNSFTQLKAAQSKFKTCVDNVAEVKPANKGACIATVKHLSRCVLCLPDKTILVPLTSSLYIPGKLSDPDHVIIDVGTGYYIKKVCTSISASTESVA